LIVLFISQKALWASSESDEATGEAEDGILASFNNDVKKYMLAQFEIIKAGYETWLEYEGGDDDEEVKILDEVLGGAKRLAQHVGKKDDSSSFEYQTTATKHITSSILFSSSK